jgi:IS5 family transposase
MRQKRRAVQRSKSQDYPLLDHINSHHPLVRLAAMIDWPAIERVAPEPVAPKPGRPPIRRRLIAGLLYLQHAFDLSDEEVVAMWIENPYWQVFTGETYLQTSPPIDPSSLSRWRKRLGEAGMEELLAQSIEAGKCHQAIEYQARDCGYHGDGKSGRLSNRFSAVGTKPQTLGESGAAMEPTPAPKL